MSFLASKEQGIITSAELVSWEDDAEDDSLDLELSFELSLELFELLFELFEFWRLKQISIVGRRLKGF